MEMRIRKQICSKKTLIFNFSIIDNYFKLYVKVNLFKVEKKMYFSMYQNFEILLRSMRKFAK